jgi:hypothetical protein
LIPLSSQTILFASFSVARVLFIQVLISSMLYLFIFSRHSALPVLGCNTSWPYLIVLSSHQESSIHLEVGHRLMSLSQQWIVIAS